MQEMEKVENRDVQRNHKKFNLSTFQQRDPFFAYKIDTFLNPELIKHFAVCSFFLLVSQTSTQVAQTQFEFVVTSFPCSLFLPLFLFTSLLFLFIFLGWCLVFCFRLEHHQSNLGRRSCISYVLWRVLCIKERKLFKRHVLVESFTGAALQVELERNLIYCYPVQSAGQVCVLFQFYHLPLLPWIMYASVIS